jgi:prepilin-type N-terminal cleavage/methylation domain-containing protein
MKRFLAGFSLLEVMVSIIIIGILTMMAMPSVRSTQSVEDKAVCIDHLRQIQWGKRRWVEQTTPANGSVVPTSSVIMGSSGWIPTYSCPSGGTYSINAVNALPTCTISGHVMP